MAVNGDTDARSSWLVSAPFDLLFLANGWWLLAFVPGFVDATGTPRLEFWQLYFLTVPHRWITLLLVAGDPDRREGRNLLFAAVAVMAFATVLGTRLASGTFLCLLFVDYIWNAWHFAAQHFGILCIYSRKAAVRGGWSDRYLVRGLVMFTALRLAAWTTGWTELSPAGRSLLTAVDGCFLLVGAFLLCMVVTPIIAKAASGDLSSIQYTIPRHVYLCSVVLLYSSLLLAVVTQQHLLIKSLAVASAAFHATEYLAVVTVYARRRAGSGSESLFKKVAVQWGAFLLLYIGLLGGVALLVGGWWTEVWLGINVWAAFLHYAYDGMIWKLRRPKTSAALGVSGEVVVSRETQLVKVNGPRPEPIGVR